MLLLLAILFALVWIAGLTFFHVTSALIHMLLVGTVISVILHFARRSRRPEHAR